MKRIMECSSWKRTVSGNGEVIFVVSLRSYLVP